MYIEGQLQTRKWQDKNGIERFVTEVILPKYKGDLKLLDGKNDDDQEQLSPYDRSFQRSFDTSDTVPSDRTPF